MEREKKGHIKMVERIPLGTADYLKSHPLSLKVHGAILQHLLCEIKYVSGYTFHKNQTALKSYQNNILYFKHSSPEGRL